MSDTLGNTEGEIQVAEHVLGSHIDEILRKEINPTERGLEENAARELIPQVIDRYRQQILTVSESPDEEEQKDRLAQLETQTHIFFLKYARSEDLENVYKLTQDENGEVRSQSTAMLIGLLQIEPEDNPEIRNRLMHELRQKIEQGEDNTTVDKAIETMVQTDSELLIPQLLSELAETPFDPNVGRALSKVADSYSFLWTIQTLRNLANKTSSPDKKHIFEIMIAHLEPEQDKQKLVGSLEELYQRINFENYEINQGTNESEAELLSNLFPDKEAAILDIGCGTGRLLRELENKGYSNLHGIDTVARHVQKTREVASHTKLAQASWHNLPYPDNYFKDAYFLGRGFLHNLTMQNQLSALREARRTLMDDGQLVLDIPDVTKGNYAQEVQKFQKEAQEKGIRNFQEGLIYDSPDGNHYYNRFAPTREQMEALAELSGFTIQEVIEKPIPNGKEDVNLYYILKKNPNFRFEDIQPERLYELFRKFAPLSATLPAFLRPNEVSPKSD